MSAIVPLTDAAELAAMHAAAFVRPWAKAEFDALIRQNAVHAFGTKNGFILMQKPRGGDEGEILTLAVRPAARRQGLARRLINHAHAALDLAHIHLEVSQANKPARALYDSLGFYEIGRRKAYYLQQDGSRVDALIMRGDFHSQM